LKYTPQGKVLLGCRRHGGNLSIEVWDTGIGIPEGELQPIFEEYRQLDNPARERKRGMGLGLSIIQRLGTLLGHRVSVRSRPGKGSVFAIEVELQAVEAKQRPESPARDGQARDGDDGLAGAVWRTGTVLVVEDDQELRELLVLVLKDDGHFVMALIAFQGDG
jgi:two-component system CheB/CheR fusion protein